MTETTAHTGQKRCHWCQQFLSDRTAKATLKEPEIYYCPPCFEKGVETESEAMGLYDDTYATESYSRPKRSMYG